MFGKPETWVAVAFLLFIALLVYLKVPKMVADMLDGRAAKIKSDLDEARKLREEAQTLLDGYKKKRAEAEQDAVNIVEAAKREAEAYANEQRKRLGESLERRARQAEQKIAQAEASAIKDVRNAATDLAVQAAAKLAGATAKGPKGAKLIDASIEAVKARLN
jgi:F-type H+-transporting ATPase subunit b